MVFAFAPIVALLLGVAAIAVPWNTLLLSVELYIVIPVIAALGPISVLALLTTLALLFGFQGEARIRWSSR